jgi:hypothetical protein
MMSINQCLIGFTGECFAEYGWQQSISVAGRCDSTGLTIYNFGSAGVWDATASQIIAGLSARLFISSTTSTDFLTAYGCGMACKTEIADFWGDQNAFVRVTAGGATLVYGNATVTIEPGCNPCVCPCDCTANSYTPVLSGAGLSGNYVKCVPQSLTISLNGTQTPEGDNGSAEFVAIKSLLASIPSVVATLKSYSTGGTYYDGLLNGQAFYQYIYPVNAYDAIYFQATLTCSDTINLYVYMADIPDVPKRSTLDNRWDIGVNGLYIRYLSFFYTGYFIGNVPSTKPTFSISSLCNGGGKTAVYDASSAADFSFGSNLQYGPVGYYAYGPIFAAMYFPDLTITLAAP